MRIKQISVTNLFGIFNHIITLNREDRITIIHGQNGVGKTALLRIINGIFNLRYSEIWSIPFSEFNIDFDDGSNLRIKKENNIDQQEDLKFYFKEDSRSKTKSFSPDIISKNQTDFPLSVIEDIIPGLDRIGPSKWRLLPTNELLSVEDVLDRFELELEKFLPGANRYRKQPAWLQNIRNSIPVRFIESQRLLNLSYSNRSRQYSQRFSMLPAVSKYAQELAEEIQDKLTEYGTLSQSLDRTFPARVVQQKSSLDITIEDLKSKINELEQKRYSLIYTGLLDKDEDQNFQVQDQIDDSTKKLLSVYVKDIEKKLDVFKEIAQKIELLKNIINRRFSYKQITISKDKGFQFTTEDGNCLSPSDLSSGEQHELVILYELLFKVKPNSLILIDEPELSLHVEWQVQFLKDLQEITKLVDIDVLIATHSPSIIHDRWDLTVQLKGQTKG